MKTVFIISLMCLVAIECTVIPKSFNRKNVIPLSQEPFDTPAYNKTEESISRNSRIVFGSTAAAGQFPHFALMFVRRPTVTVQCGAGLIAPQWVLTADHCVREAISIELRFGLTHRDSFEQRIYGIALARNPETDMALVQMASSARQTGYVKPALLPRKSERNDLYVKKAAIICGMGIENQQTNKVSTYLKFAELEVMLQADCNKYYGDVNINMLCALSTVSYASSCPGDSGSPLIIKEGNAQVVIGVVSFGAAKGCDLGYPVGYARTTRQLDWIAYYTGLTIRD